MKKNIFNKGGNGDIVECENGSVKKMLRNTSTSDKIARFKLELEIANNFKGKKLNNVVEIIDVYIDEKNIQNSYINMKKYDGNLYNLYEFTKGNARYSLSLLLPIIKALNILSEQNPAIYHRDIKPDNILFLKNDDNFELFLTDFGTAFVQAGNIRFTPESLAIGPRMFIAPEYEKGRVEDVNEKGDIFSLGKVLWSMINGNAADFLPSNFWFVNEYNLTKRFPNDSDMFFANIIISSCLKIDPKNRSDYSNLISQIEAFLTNSSLLDMELYKIKEYQEKRKMELLEIKEKNKLLVNYFSKIYLDALTQINVNFDIDVLTKLHETYKRKSSDGYNYISQNVENNTAHYLYGDKIDKIYFAINYNPPGEKEIYSNITLRYDMDCSNTSRMMKIYYDNQGTIVAKIENDIEQFSIQPLKRFIETLLQDYIKE